MSEDQNEKPKRQVRRKPLWLMIPAGQRTVEAAGVSKVEVLYTMEQFTSVVELRKSLEAREMDQTNAKGILLFRADAIPVETKMKAQIVFKFGGSDEGDEEGEG